MEILIQLCINYYCSALLTCPSRLHVMHFTSNNNNNNNNNEMGIQENTRMGINVYTGLLLLHIKTPLSLHALFGFNNHPE